MKKYSIVPIIPIVLSLGMLSWAQGSKDLFDAKKSEAELEIMKGILGTTISYVAQDEHKDTWRRNTSNMSAYYLAGQGAVFMIPTSTIPSTALRSILVGPDMNLRNLELAKLNEQTRLRALEVQKQAVVIQKQAAELSPKGAGAGLGSGVGSGIGGGTGTGSPTPFPQIMVATPTQTNRDEIQKKVQELQLAIKKTDEEAAAKQEKFLESLKNIRGHLVEALANYGDSLTQVKSGEYINLILDTNPLNADPDRTKTRYDIISAQKSWIADFKAGRITLENFKQKVLQYAE